MTRSKAFSSTVLKLGLKKLDHLGCYIRPFRMLHLTIVDDTSEYLRKRRISDGGNMSLTKISLPIVTETIKSSQPPTLWTPFQTPGTCNGYFPQRLLNPGICNPSIQNGTGLAIPELECFIKDRGLRGELTMEFGAPN